MKVALIAHTVIDWRHLLKILPRAEDGPGSADYLAEFAGRACYESWGRPNPQTAENHSYLRNIVERQHFSVLEHASATFYVTEVSRTLTHELVRHRHLSYSQRSQRYVDESSNVTVIPDAVQAISDARLGNDQTVREAVDQVQDMQRELYVQIQSILREKGATVKEARGAARFVLPAGAQTAIVVSGNMRAWRDFLSKRWHAAAEPEIRRMALLVLMHLKGIAPNSFQDFDVNRPVGTPATDA